MRSLEANDSDLRSALCRGSRPDPSEHASGRPADVKEATSHPAKAASGTLLARRDLTDRLAIFRLAKPPGLSFEPGQHVRVHSAGDSRPYTIVSAPHEPFLELFVERAPTGSFTPALWRLKPGDRVGLGDVAKGSLVLDPSKNVHLMIATVTGVAPFVSMLRATFAAGGAGRHRFHVLHGASRADELGYADELGRLPIVYVPTVSRPEDPRNAAWTGPTGRVHTLVEAHVEAHALRPDDTAAYACGHPEMVRAVERMLGERGYRVRTERFFKE